MITFASSPITQSSKNSYLGLGPCRGVDVIPSATGWFPRPQLDSPLGQDIRSTYPRAFGVTQGFKWVVSFRRKLIFAAIYMYNPGIRGSVTTKINHLCART